MERPLERRLLILARNVWRVWSSATDWIYLECLEKYQALQKRYGSKSQQLIGEGGDQRLEGVVPSPHVRTPLLLQLEATECGAAALGIILEHHGRVVPLSELRVECGVSRDGSKASNILRAARHYGLQCKGFKESFESAVALETPYIVFWNFNHFLVVEGFDLENRLVFLNDPAHGHRKVTLTEFDESFTGVTLLFEPSEEFVSGGEKPELLDAIARRLEKAHDAIRYCLYAGLILTIPGLVIPAFTQVYLDFVLGEFRQDWLKPLVLAMALTIAIKIVAEALKYRYLRRLKIHLSVSMSAEFFWHLLKLPMGFYSQRYSGEIAARQELNDNLADILSGRLADTAIDLIMMSFYALLMMYYNFFLTIIGLLFAMGNFMALKFFSQRRVEANTRLRQDFGKVAADTIAALQSMETIKAAGQESTFFSKWSGRYSKAANSMQELQLATQSLSVLPTLFSTMTTIFVYVIGGISVIRGDMTIGTLVAFTALMAAFQEPIKNLVSLGGEIQELDGDLKRLDDVLLAEPDSEAISLGTETEDELASQTAKLSGGVRLQDITFGYNPLDTPLLEDVTIDIPAGSRVAFVGGSGSGKSTLAYLVCGLLKPWQGSILFDGMPRGEIAKALMTRSCALVSQEIALFEGTVRQNLTLWDDTIPDEILLRSLEDAAILDVVLSLPGGLDGHLLEGGVNLSGGQRQRLEIARALIQNPAVLIFDEATSALDTETERVVDERLKMRGCTCILVAHRLSTIRDCDEIIVLDRGKIVERGNHEQLWQLQGFYAELLRAGDDLGDEG